MRSSTRFIVLASQGIPEGVKASYCELTKIHEWPSSSSEQETSALILDLDDLAQTKKLDDWALSAWKNTFNDLIARNTHSRGQAPLLLAFTRNPNWEKAQLALRVGARELVSLTELSARLDKLFPESPELSDPKVVAIDSKRKKEIPRIENASPIPRHAIPFPIDGLEGTSNAIEVVRNIVRKSSGLDTSILIVGPTGSGKERVARCLHQYSSRAQAPFIAVNCGALSPQLVEAEFFGHSAGAFTGAIENRKGYLEAAHGGTLFLDEVSELPLDVQVKLLRFLQEKTVTPVGSTESISLDIRLISASLVDLDERVKVGLFREDFLYRIRVMEIELPSLSERKADIPELSKIIMKKLSKRHKRPVLTLSDAVLEKFIFYSWPGNIRELENALEHGATLAWAEEKSEITLSHLPETLQFVAMKASSEQDLKEAVRRFERSYIASTIRRLGGSKEEAAEALGLSLATLYRKLGA